ncbi:hypothetical protein [Streptomyces sp. NPDC002962]|uniref:hypothetical protein n=1 Tax=Streptomyces sp. NPDC002962 TaxID=3364674 RepID=UPI003677C305
MSAELPVTDEEDEGSMMLNVGQRVRLAADLWLAGSVIPAEESPEETGTFAASLALAAGIEGTVERVDEHDRQQSHEVREYLRLKSLLDDFGHQMPPETRKQLEEQVGGVGGAVGRLPATEAPRHSPELAARARAESGSASGTAARALVRA